MTKPARLNSLTLGLLLALGGCGLAQASGPQQPSAMPLSKSSPASKADSAKAKPPARRPTRAYQGPRINIIRPKLVRRRLAVV